MSVQRLDKEFSDLVTKISTNELRRNPKVKAAIAEIRSMIARLKRHMSSDETKKAIREGYRTIAMLR